MKKLKEIKLDKLVVIFYEAEETQEFEVGKWYSHEDVYAFVKKPFNEDNEDAYVCDYFEDGQYFENVYLDIDGFQPADMEEVKKLMIAEAERRYPKGIRFKDICDNEVFEVCSLDFTLKSFESHPAIVVKSINLKGKDISGYIWSPEKGWAKIVEPLFVNSLGEKFYEDSECAIVAFSDHRIITGTTLEFKSYEENSSFTEIMTKQSAEEWVKKNRKFEDGAYYKAVYDGESLAVQYSGGLFYTCGSGNYMEYEDFDSIGDKIEF